MSDPTYFQHNLGWIESCFDADLCTVCLPLSLVVKTHCSIKNNLIGPDDTLNPEMCSCHITNVPSDTLTTHAYQASLSVHVLIQEANKNE